VTIVKDAIIKDPRVRAGRAVSARLGTPTRPPLNPIVLLDLVKQFGARASAWESSDGSPLEARSYELLELADDVEVWVIHWPAGGHLQLHDHGGSAGAFWVVSGSLEERYFTRGHPAGDFGRRGHAAASGAAFGAEYVHDVHNGGDTPATSVHAYSPPMPGMTYYRTAGDSLVAEHTEYRSDPSWAP
jgi:hypothetical protein